MKYLSIYSSNKSAIPEPFDVEVLLKTTFISLPYFFPSSSLTFSSKYLSILFPINAIILYFFPYSVNSGYHIVFILSNESLLVISYTKHTIYDYL